MAGLGAAGGLVNGLLSGKGLEMPGLRRAGAALVTWGVYGPFASVDIFADAGKALSSGSTAGQLLGALGTGIGGARILSAEVDRRVLKVAASKAAGADGSDTAAQEIANASPSEALAIAEALPRPPP